MISLLSAGVTLWRVLAICIPLVVSSAGLAYLIGYKDGVNAERLAVAKAGTQEAQAWSRWLSDTSGVDASFDAQVRSVTVSNVLAAKKVDDASDSSSDTECLSDSFVRSLGELR